MIGCGPDLNTIYLRFKKVDTVIGSLGESDKVNKVNDQTVNAIIQSEKI